MPASTERIIGEILGDPKDPTLIVVAGLHGNEPSGIRALRRVFHQLDQSDNGVTGTLVGYIGDLAAVEQNERFIDQDLNRIWHLEQIEMYERGESGGSAAAERKALLSMIDDAIGRTSARTCVLDLHSTSSRSIPFGGYYPSRENIELAAALPLRFLDGGVDNVQGALFQFITMHYGCASLIVESGLHDDPLTVDNHEALVWILLVELGMLGKEQVPQYDQKVSHLESQVDGIPKELEIFYTHHVTPEDQFRMEPGYANFQRVSEGEILGRDVRGEIPAMSDAYLFMPLYQKVGDIGFALVREKQN